MILLGELLEMCNKKNTRDIVLEYSYMKEGKKESYKIPMISGHYIEDNIWYSSVCKTVGDLMGATPVNNVDFIFEMERECLSNEDEWGDLYESPMEQLGNCELRFCRDMKNIEETTLNITTVEETDKEIIIKLED